MLPLLAAATFGVLTAPVSDAHLSPARASVAHCFGRAATIVAPGSGPVVGTAQDDVIVAGPHTVVRAGRGDDRVCGGAQVHGGPGNDRIRIYVSDPESSALAFGGTGADLLVLGGGFVSTAWGGAGADRLVGRDGGQNLVGGLGDDRLTGGPGRDRLFGKKGSDVLRGQQGSDGLFGGRGDDVLYGNGGDDGLRAGPGDDVGRGGPGWDWCDERTVEHRYSCERADE